MSTNSVVAYLRTDGSIVSSYVHYDGYETGVVMALLEHFNDDKVSIRLFPLIIITQVFPEACDASLRDSVHSRGMRCLTLWKSLRCT